MKRAFIFPIILSGLLTACAHSPSWLASRDSLSAEEHFKLGTVYEMRGSRQQAAQQYKVAILQDPAYADAWVALGDLKSEIGDIAAAEGLYRRALEFAPHHVNASVKLAQAYVAQDKELAEAERLAREVIRQDGESKGYSLDVLANIYLRQGRLVDAQTALERAESAASPDDPILLDRIARTQERIKDAQAESDS